MIDIIVDTLLDTFKLIPFLFFTFLVIELLEHKINNKKLVASSGRFGPVVGSFLGVFPQCGFSASVTNFYATRVVSLGTLIAVYLSTSDEMLPILIANKVDVSVIVKIVLLKFFIGMVFGFLIDLFFRRKENVDFDKLCSHDHCECNHNNVFISSLMHTLSISLFVLIFCFFVNIIFEYLGHDFLSRIFMKNTVFSHFLSSLVGLIPNCGSSIMITELYLSNTITFGACMSGLLTGCGVGILILFKTNGLKDSIKVVSITYLIGVLSGIIIDMVGFLV